MKLNKQSNLLNHNNSKGVLIIEMMIGLLMASITILVSFSIYAQFEGEKRTIVQTSQTVATNGLSLSVIETHAKVAGYGIPNRDFLGCNVNYYNSQIGSGTEGSFSLLPLSITPGATSLDSDSITFLYGNNNLVMAPLNLTTQAAFNDTQFLVDSKWGTSPGNLIIFAESGKNCNLFQVSSVDNYSNAIFKDTGTYQIDLYTYPIQFNKSGGLTVHTDYQIGATVFNLGNEPTYVRYFLDNKQLKERNLWNNNESVIADNIMIMKARYGLDTNGDGSIDEWRANITDMNDYKLLKSLKIGLITQSPLKERPNQSTGSCNITTNPTYSFGTETIDITDIVTDWQCYRYRFIQSEFVLRNIIWTNSL